MDIKAEVEKIVNNSSFSKVVQTTVPFIEHLIANDVQITEAVFRYYFNHISAPINKNKELFEFVTRDLFAYNCELLLQEHNIVEDRKKEEIETKKIIAPASKMEANELTPEMLAAMEKDLPPYKDPEPSEFFMELQKLLGDKDEE